VFDFWLASRDAELWYKEWFHAAQNPTWELDEFSWLVRPGDRILEIGCHHGFLSMMLAHRIGPDGSLFAIDANPENAMIAGSQFSLNGLSNCAAKHLAAGDRSEVLEMAWRTNSHVVYDGEIATKYSVQAMTGDELDKLYGPFDLIKIDVEGFEVSVLKGCRQLLERKPKMILEVHPEMIANYGSTLSGVWSILEPYRYGGTMLHRGKFGTVHEFSPRNVPPTDVTYLHLA
jgi:FkbM family methyltransferase